MTEIELLIGLVCLLVLLVAWLIWQTMSSTKNTLLLQSLEDKHRGMLLDVNNGLNALGDRLNNSSQESGDRLKTSVAQELTSTREAMQKLQLEQSSNLSQTRETVLEKLHTTLAEQGTAQQGLINDTMLKATTTLTQSIESLSRLWMAVWKK